MYDRAREAARRGATELDSDNNNNNNSEDEPAAAPPIAPPVAAPPVRSPVVAPPSPRRLAPRTHRWCAHSSYTTSPCG
eukprot:Transcript_10575.p3 GENE.Transcript_10575~~Transcript_10575.p3  ORF type:complete len:86 (-),score=14.71 Transcript_10575:61-294(-)